MLELQLRLQEIKKLQAPGSYRKSIIIIYTSTWVMIGLIIITQIVNFLVAGNDSSDLLVKHYTYLGKIHIASSACCILLLTGSFVYLIITMCKIDFGRFKTERNMLVVIFAAFILGLLAMLTAGIIENKLTHKD